MFFRARTICATGVAAVLLAVVIAGRPVSGQAAAGALAISAGSGAPLRDSDDRVSRMLRSGELRVRQTVDDPLVAGRLHERSDQYYRGVRVFGGDVARQSAQGLTESVFGTVYEGIDLSTSPVIGEERARAVLEARTGVASDPSQRPELLVLPLDGGGYLLTWRLRIVTRGDARQYFIDARTGAAVLDYSDRKTQTAVGRARIGWLARKRSRSSARSPAER